jgi:hypothetical protein
MILQIIHVSAGFFLNWRKDFLSLIWRYAISWTSGYFIFQIYTPLMFKFHGPVTAGKVGISLTLATAVFSIANVWIYVAIPKLNICVSLRNWKSMDRLLIKSLSLAVLTFLSGSIFIIAVFYFYAGKLLLLNRFLGIIPMAMLLGAWNIQLIINGLAVYLRAHKKEPLVLFSTISALYTAISTLIIASYLPPNYLFLGFLSSVMLGLPFVLGIFFRKRKEWHNAILV